MWASSTEGHTRGVNPNAPPSDAVILDIYNSPGTLKKVAERHGISISGVSRIKNGSRWADVTGHGQ